MIHPDTELRFINDKIGHGVVATRFIPKGTITWALDKLDRIFTGEEIAKMDKMYQLVLDKYTYRNSAGNYVLCWDNARYVNHSSRSNCITTAYEFEIAVRDIQPGEELTDDYGYLNLEQHFEVAHESGSSRSIIYPDDLLRFYSVWDEKLLETFPAVINVSQPLLPILDDHLRSKVGRIARGEEKMDSILHCYYADSNPQKDNSVLDKQSRSPRVIYPY